MCNEYCRYKVFHCGMSSHVQECPDSGNSQGTCLQMKGQNIHDLFAVGVHKTLVSCGQTLFWCRAIITKCPHQFTHHSCTLCISKCTEFSSSSTIVCNFQQHNNAKHSLDEQFKMDLNTIALLCSHPIPPMSQQ